MARKPEAERGGAAQSQRFVETARALGCDEDEAAFRDKLRVIARQKPKDEPKPRSAMPVGEKGRAGKTRSG